MTTFAKPFAALGLLLLYPATALPQYDPASAPTDSSAAVVVDGTPSTAAPAPPPPSVTPPAPPVQVQAPVQTPPPRGQWVYTQQYGWIWMPYADNYTYVPADGYGAPYAYVYYPTYGWTWLVAPWIWGYGPWPYFGVYGPASFGWYGHSWWRYPSRWTYAPPRAGFGATWSSPYRAGYRSGAVFSGASATPFRRAVGGGGAGFAPRASGGGAGFAPHASGGGAGFAPRASGGGRGWGGGHGGHAGRR